MSYTSRIPQITAELAAAIDTALDEGASVIARDAAGRINRGPEPHHLAEDIHVENAGALAKMVVAGRTDTFYGHILEHGSVHAAPRPFLIPALEANQAKVISMAHEAVRRLTS